MKFIDDLKLLNDLDKDQFNLLVEEINKNPMRLSADIAQFESFCEINKIERNIATKLYAVLSHICGYLIDNRSIEKGIAKIEDSIINPHFEDVSKIWNLIKLNLINLSQFINIRKERNLSDVIPGIREFNIICDVRPVFDLERQKIIKYIYPIILSFRPDSGESRVAYEIEDNDLTTLQDEVNTAVRKLEIIKQSIENE